MRLLLEELDIQPLNAHFPGQGREKTRGRHAFSFQGNLDEVVCIISAYISSARTDHMVISSCEEG